MNLTLITSFYLVIVFRLDIALLFYLASLLLQSFLGADFLIFPAFAAIVVLYLINLLIERVFTNRSYYVLVTLSLLGWLLYHACFAFAVFVTRFFSNSALPEISLRWISQVLFFSIPLLILTSLGYLVTSYFSVRFKSYFITSER